jgi:hypothetical protein
MQIGKFVSQLAKEEALDLKNIINEVRDEKTLLSLVKEVAKVYDDCCMIENHSLVESTCVHNKARKYLDGNRSEQNG